MEKKSELTVARARAWMLGKKSSVAWGRLESQLKEQGLSLQAIQRIRNIYTEK